MRPEDAGIGAEPALRASLASVAKRSTPAISPMSLAAVTATIEGEKHALGFSHDFAQNVCDWFEPLRERIVRRDVDAKERASVFVVRVIVRDSRQDTLVLHPPATANRSLAGVWPEMIVDVVDAARATLGVREKAAKHGEVERHGTEIFGQLSHHESHHRRRRTCARAKKRRTCRRRDPAYAFDASLSERESNCDGIERNAKIRLLHALGRRPQAESGPPQADHHRHGQVQERQREHHRLCALRLA